MTMSKPMVMLSTQSYLFPYQPYVWVNRNGRILVQVKFKNCCVMSFGLFESRYISKIISSARDCRLVNDTLPIFWRQLMDQKENSYITKRMSIIILEPCSVWKAWRRHESYRCCWSCFSVLNNLSLLPRTGPVEGKGKNAGIATLEAS